VLAAVADALREGLRGVSDQTFRLGGEEFPVVAAVRARAVAALYAAKGDGRNRVAVVPAAPRRVAVTA